MKLKEYLEKLNQLAYNNQELLEYDVVYSRDDEGNGYQEVCYDPSAGYLDEDGYWHSLENMNNESEYYEENYPDAVVNSVCVN